MRKQRNRWGLVVALGVAFVLGAPRRGATQDVTEPQRVTVVGRVVDGITRLPITGVTVDLPELGVQLLTDSNGQFEIKGLLLGVYDLGLRAPGYQDAQGNFAVMRDGSFVTTLMPRNAAMAAPRGRLVGVVSGQSGAPLEGVRVQVPGLFLDGLTGEDGRFVFGSVPPGRHAVEFSSLGYATRVDTVEVASGLTSDARVSMAVSAVEIAPLTVTVERRELALERNGFYERRTIGQGDFIDREVIEVRRPQGLTDLFTGIAGAELRLGNPGQPLSRALVLRGGRRDLDSSGQPCFPTVYIDGVPVHFSGPDPAYIDQLIRPEEVAGIELFQSAAEVPVQFGGINASCGVVVIWTRN